MEKSIFDGNLGFWDYVTIAFYTKFAPKKLAVVGPVRAIAYSLPNGKTFFSSSPRLQELRPLPELPGQNIKPLAVPRDSVVPGGEHNPAPFYCTSASLELDDEFEAAIQKRDAEELAAAFSKNHPEASTEQVQAVTESLVVARDGVDHMHSNEEK